MKHKSKENQGGDIEALMKHKLKKNWGGNKED
jgi:hypothetical protein